MAGAVTSTYEGTFDIDDAALITELDTLTTGAATAANDTTDVRLVYVGNGQIAVYTLARGA